jgi:hypothetical protein
VILARAGPKEVRVKNGTLSWITASLIREFQFDSQINAVMQYCRVPSQLASWPSLLLPLHQPFKGDKGNCGVGPRSTITR